jgi:phenylpyruvate tautomerase PptA (4-oxalocrotonate tautomerase family)
MPLARIDVLPGTEEKTLTQLGDAVYRAMRETIDVPEGDLFQILTRHGEGGIRYDPAFLGVRRDDGVVFISLTMRAGRTPEQKRALYRRIVELAADAGVAARNVLITITENELIDWSFGEGEAQLAR